MQTGSPERHQRSSLQRTRQIKGNERTGRAKMNTGEKSIKGSTETTQEGLNQILLGRNVDRIIGYINMKMSTAVAVNGELSGIRTQVLQMGWFLTVALVLGTGGLNSFFEWSQTALLVSVSVTLLVAAFAMDSMRTLTAYTDIVMEEHQRMETLYCHIVWHGFADTAAIAQTVAEIESDTRGKVDDMNKKHRLLTGTILHSMIHFERDHAIFGEVNTT
ncbi:MAG: hypothetical protein O3C36_01035 [archaeon]|nr:hypothetical protein [archaeon]